MAYSDAMKAVTGHRSGKIAALLGETKQSWFLSAWGSISAMLKAFGSNDENKAVASLYKSGTATERMRAHVKLDYVCGLRREVRKQYVSGEDGLYTDVTPFRHGVMSANGANLFDNALDQLLAMEVDG